MTQDKTYPPTEPDRSSENSLRIENEVLRRGFTIIPNTVLRTRRISRDAKLLYGILLSYAWQKGSCWPGYDTLTDDLECGRSQLSKWIGELKAAGLIAVQRRGQGLTSIYTIKDGPPEEIQKSQNGTTGSPASGLQAVPPRDSKKYEEEEDAGKQDAGSISNRDRTLSKFRKGTPTNFQEVKPVEQGRPRPAKPQPTGFASVASVLTQTSHPTGAPQPISTPVAAGVTTPTTNAPTTAFSSISERQMQPSTSSAPRAPAIPASAEERALLLAYLRDYAAEFHDQASLKSSVTRAHRLFAQSALPAERWVEKLYEAHRVTRERSAAIGYQGKDGARTSTTSTGLVNKMPYFFASLECVLGLHDHPAGQHPMPLSEEAFQNGKGNPGRGSRRSRSTTTEPSDGPERPSLAGRYAHLVRR